MKIILVFLISSFLLSACLMTRNDLKEQEQKQALQEQVQSLQQTNAQEQVRQQEYDDQMRTLISRIDSLESRLKQLQSAASHQEEGLTHVTDDSAQKFKAFEDEIVKIENQMTSLAQDLDELKKSKLNTKEDTRSSSSPLQQAEESLKNKDWKGAIVLLQKYRDKNPKGKKYPEATYKIGLCFKELAMRAESKAFFEEVIEKFPSSPEAKKSKTQLKSLK